MHVSNVISDCSVCDNVVTSTLVPGTLLPQYCTIYTRVHIYIMQVYSRAVTSKHTTWDTFNTRPKPFFLKAKFFQNIYIRKNYFDFRFENSMGPHRWIHFDDFGCKKVISYKGAFIEGCLQWNIPWKVSLETTFRGISHKIPRMPWNIATRPDTVGLRLLWAPAIVVGRALLQVIRNTYNGTWTWYLDCTFYFPLNPSRLFGQTYTLRTGKMIGHPTAISPDAYEYAWQAPCPAKNKKTEARARAHPTHQSKRMSHLSESLN